MKFAFASICLVFLLIGVNSAPQNFHYGGLEGIIDGKELINGEEKKVDVKSLNNVEEMVKSMIHNYLDNKKQAKEAKKAARKEKVPKQVTQADIPDKIKNFKWEENPEIKAVVEEKIPGGTAAVDALIKLIQERNVKT